MRPTLLTLAVPVQGNQVLLGLKKKGLGAGLWNAFGGKVDPGETIEQAAIRELEEEVGIGALEYSQSGIVRITYHDTDELAAGLSLSSKKISKEVEMHVFRVTAWEREPAEPAEMKPRWFGCEEIPYETMWPDDKYWLPLVLQGKCFDCRCVFENKDMMISHEVREVEGVPAADYTA